MAARRRPCEHCRRRHRRWLVTGAAVAATAALVAFLSVTDLSSPGGVQLADASVRVSHPVQVHAVSSPHVLALAVPPIQQYKLKAITDAGEPPPVPASSSTVPAHTAVPPAAHAAVQAPAPPAKTAAAPPPPPAPAVTRTATTPPPAPAPVRTTAAVSSGSSVGGRVLAEAMTREGYPYVYGAAGPDAFDCSGLVYWAAQQLGITGMPRDTYEMLAQGVADGTLVQTWSPQRGDLAFFGTGHVEFYISSGETFGAQQPGTNVGFHSYGYGYVPTMFFRIV